MTVGHDTTSGHFSSSSPHCCLEPALVQFPREGLLLCRSDPHTFVSRELEHFLRRLVFERKTRPSGGHHVSSKRTQWIWTIFLTFLCVALCHSRFSFDNNEDAPAEPSPITGPLDFIRTVPTIHASSDCSDVDRSEVRSMGNIFTSL